MSSTTARTSSTHGPARSRSRRGGADPRRVEVPSINDITASELAPLVERVAAFDPVVREAIDGKRLRVVSAKRLPVIDLSRTSTALAEAAKGADLVVLEGMGRAIETNLRAKFVCDALKLGMVKHPEVATCLGGELYDCVCRFG